MADRQAALCEQQALEASLLRQATAAIWSARGGATGGKGENGRGSDVGVEGLRTRTHPLGPRLAWLAGEELISFFQHSASVNAGAANTNTDARGRLGGYSSNSSETNNSPTESPLSLLQPPLSRSRYQHQGAGSRQQLFRDTESHKRAFGGVVGGDEASPPLLVQKDDLVKKAVVRMELNLVLPSGAHRGTLFDPASPCGFCGLALSTCPSSSSSSVADVVGDSCNDANGADVASRGGDIGAHVAVASWADSVAHGSDDVDIDYGNEIVVKVKACGHGYHARCLASSSAGGAHWRGWGIEKMGLLYLPCPQCT